MVLSLQSDKACSDDATDNTDILIEVTGEKIMKFKTVCFRLKCARISSSTEGPGPYQYQIKGSLFLQAAWLVDSQYANQGI